MSLDQVLGPRSCPILGSLDFRLMLTHEADVPDLHVPDEAAAA